MPRRPSAPPPLGTPYANDLFTFISPDGSSEKSIEAHDLAETILRGFNPYVSTLGGDIEKILNIPASWQPASGGGDFNGIFLDIVSDSPTNRSALYGMNLYLEVGGTGHVDAVTGIKTVIQAKGTTVNGHVVQVHGNNASNISVMHGAKVESFPPPNATVTTSTAFVAEQRGGTGSIVNLSYGIHSSLDASGGGVLRDHTAFLASTEFASNGTVEKWTGFRVGIPRQGGTLGSLIGLDIPDIEVGSFRRACRTGLGYVEFGDRVLQAVPNSEIPDAELKEGQCSLYLDEANNTLTVKAKYSDGTVKTGSMNLA